MNDGCAVELMLCWDDHTWSSEVFVFVEDESQIDSLPRLYLEYLGVHKKAECEKHHSEGGYGGLVQVAVYSFQDVNEDIAYVYDYKLINGVLSEVNDEETDSRIIAWKSEF